MPSRRSGRCPRRAARHRTCSALDLSVTATSPISIRTRLSFSGCPANGPSGPRFHSTTAGSNSATTTVASGGSKSSVARSVKPIPRPPMSTQGCSSVRARPAGERGQRLLRAVHAAGHQALAVGEDDVLVVAAGQLQRCRPGATVSPSNSKCLTIAISYLGPAAGS